MSRFWKRFQPKGNPFHPLSAAGDAQIAHRRKWGFVKGSPQLIGFGTLEYTEECCVGKSLAKTKENATKVGFGIQKTQDMWYGRA